MFVSRIIFNALDELTKNFNHNYSITVDFLFYVFDRFSYEEKKNILKACPLMKDKKGSEKGKKDKTDTKENKNCSDSLKSKELAEEIKIEIHPLLEERLINLILECDKLESISDAIEFLLFVSKLIEKDLMLDLLIQYSIEAIQVSDFNYLNETKLENYEIPSPFHYIPTPPDRTQIFG